MASFISDELDFSKYMEDTDAKAKVKPAREWMEDIKEKMKNPEDADKVTYLPWEFTKNLFQLRYGEVTLWAGVNGHGKTLITTQTALGLVSQGERVCIASFEMKPIKTIERALRMFSGENCYSPVYQNERGINIYCEIIDDFASWTDEKLWLYDQTGSVDRKKVAAMIRYCNRELKIRHIFIDSLMKCIKGEDDYNGQKDFVDELCAIAKEENCHIHLIHHIRKTETEGKLPDKYDVKGSGSIIDQVDNVNIVYRNKPKENEYKERGELSTKKNDFDALIRVCKQRNGDYEPDFKMTFETSSNQFIEFKKDGPKGEPLDFKTLYQV